MRRTSKLWIAGAFILAGAMLIRFAWAIIADPFSIVIIITGTVLFIGGIIYFVSNFRE